ncbi:DUF4153 domain-containing protein [Micromonospora sp. NPDC050397]|uniref:DUF4153 domain-containing protein n=1 Tax=Micromonospora sp. NPDC050397 TaxID=3364279 RepID=UPI00384D7696
MPTQWTMPARPPLAPAPPSIWRRRWPGPAAGASPVVLTLIAVAAVIAAASIPLDRGGVGWLVSTVAGTAALGTAIRWRTGTRSTASTPTTASDPATASTVTTASDPTTASTVTTASNPTTASKPTADDRQVADVAASVDTSDAGPTTGRPAGSGNPDPGTATGKDQVRSGATGAPDRTGALEPVRLPQARPGLDRVLWAAATVALVSVGTFRAAGWLFTLCLLAAAVTGCLTAFSGKSLPGIFFSVLLAPAAVFRSRRWAASGIRQADRTGQTGFGRGLATAAVSIALLVVFGALFASADAVFANLLDALLPELSVATVFRWIFVGGTVGAGLLGAAYVLSSPPDLSGLERASRHRLRRMEWAVPVALLDLLFAAFVLVQLTTLFGGSEHVLETAGLTYAEHARSGFWQLLAVTLLTLLVIGGAARWAPRDTPAQRLLVQLLLGALALFSLVVVASALYRMNIYTQAYGATRLRLLVAVCELWLGAVFVLILVAGVRLRATWLPRLVLGAAVLALLGLAVANPDRLIADRNVDRFFQTERLDLGYVSGLSADAVPALDRLPDPQRDCALREIAQHLSDHPDDWRGANLGRYTAWQLLLDDPVTGPGQHYGTCPTSR